MSAAETRLHERVAAMPLRPVPGTGRTWQVRSTSDPELWHTCRGGHGDTFEGLTCSCRGGKGRCAHKVRLAWHLGIDVPEPTPARQPPTEAATMSTTRGASAGKDICFTACIPMIQSAVKVAGDGGVRLTIDVADSDYDAVMDFVRQARGRSFRLVPVWDTDDQATKDGEP